MVYPLPPNQQPVYVQLTRPPSNGSAIASLILGIIAIVVGFWSIIPLLGVFAAVTAFLPAVVGVIFGHIGMSRARRLQGLGKGSAMAGLIMGYATLAIIVLTTLFWVLAISAQTNTPM